MPEGWLTVNELSERGLIRVEDGNHGEYRPLREEFVSDGTPFVRPPDLVSGRVQLDSCDKINATARARVRKGIGKGGDILFTHRATVGRLALTPSNEREFVANPGVTIWRVLDENVLDRRFLYYWMHTKEFLDQVWAVAGSTDTFPYISLIQQRELKVSVPDVELQRAIGSALGALDDKIDLNRRMNVTLEEMARAIFKDWFVDFGPTRAKMEGRAPYLAPDLWALFPDRLDDGGRPEGWETNRLGAFTVLQNGYAFKSADWQEEGVPVVKIGSVKPAVVDLSEVSYVSPVLAKDRAAFQLNVGDVLVGLTGYVGEAGRVPPTTNPPLLNQRVARFSSSGRFSPLVYACVRDPAFKLYAEGKAHGSAQPNVSTRDLLDYSVINPGIRIVGAFEDLVGPLFDKSLGNLGEIGELATTRELLLPKLMSGEIRLREAEKAVEPAL